VFGVVVFERARRRAHDMNERPQSRERLRELETRGPTADDRKTLRTFFEVEDRIRRLVGHVELQGRGIASGTDHECARRERYSRIAPAHEEAARIEKGGIARDRSHAESRERLGRIGARVDRLARAIEIRANLRPHDVRLGVDHPEDLCHADAMCDRSDVEKRLARHAATPRALTAESVAFDDRRLRTERRADDCRNEARRTTAEHHEIVQRTHARALRALGVPSIERNERAHEHGRECDPKRDGPDTCSRNDRRTQPNRERDRDGERHDIACELDCMSADEMRVERICETDQNQRIDGARVAFRAKTAMPCDGPSCGAHRREEHDPNSPDRRTRRREGRPDFMRPTRDAEERERAVCDHGNRDGRRDIRCESTTIVAIKKRDASAHAGSSFSILSTRWIGSDIS